MRARSRIVWRVFSVFGVFIAARLALGIGDYFEKTGAFKTIGVALSDVRLLLASPFGQSLAGIREVAFFPPMTGG